MEPVILRSPTGQPYTTRDASEVTRLVYGHGYTRETHAPEPEAEPQLAADEPHGDESGVEDDEHDEFA